MARILQRYGDRDRMNHWFIALMFVLAGLSGLAFFHPALFFLSNLFGGGAWARILHPFLGVLMFVAFMGLFVRLWQDNVFIPADKEWRAHMGDMLRGDKTKMPPVGKYNAGQKHGVLDRGHLPGGAAGHRRAVLAPLVRTLRAHPLMRAAVLLHSIAAVVWSSCRPSCTSTPPSGSRARCVP
jgi:formate dehydrogenase subunit gamma